LGLAPVDYDLDEPDGLVAGPESTLGHAGFDLIAGHPAFVGVAVHGRLLQQTLRKGDVAVGETGALGQVVVVGPGRSAST